jgi:hypothetical protein
LKKIVTEIKSLNDPLLDTLIGSHADNLREEVELIQGVYDDP